MSTRLIVGILFFTTLVGGFFVWQSDFNGGSVELPPKMLPEIILKNAEGVDVRLSEFKGRPLLVNGWATWCPYCKKELFDFATLQEEYGSTTLRVIAINRGESAEIVAEYARRSNLNGKIIFLLDQSDLWYKAINGFSMPETVFVDKEGVIRYHKRGPMELEEMRRRTKEIFGI